MPSAASDKVTAAINELIVSGFGMNLPIMLRRRHRRVRCILPRRWTPVYPHARGVPEPLAKNVDRAIFVIVLAESRLARPAQHWQRTWLCRAALGDRRALGEGTAMAKTGF